MDSHCDELAAVSGLRIVLAEKISGLKIVLAEKMEM